MKLGIHACNGLLIALMMGACSDDPHAAESQTGSGDAEPAGGAEAGVGPDAGSDGGRASELDAAADSSVAVDASAPTDSQVERDARTPAPDAAIKQYEDLGNGTVRDPVTNVIWQQAYAPTSLSWEGAKAYCAGLTLASSTSWRLPTLEELLGIVDRTRVPALDTTAFPGTPSKDFWSSESGHDTQGYADGVSFSDGSWFSSVPGDLNYARCVR